VQRFGYGTRASLAKFQSIFGGEITRLALDIVQLADVAQRIFGNLASTGDMQVIELTARVGSATNFGHALGEQLLIAREVIAH
jgi:hypothetical protein